MNQLFRLSARCVCVALLLVSVASEARAQTSADFFDNSTLQDVQLFINTRDLAQLRQRYDENTYYTADFVWRGMPVFAFKATS